MVLLSNCVEKQGYYNDGEESIIALICDITWTGGKKEYEDGSSWESIWNFDKDGTYTPVSYTHLTLPTICSV